MPKENRDTHEAFMNLAIRLSVEKMLKGNGGPFGAVVVQNGKVIGEGWNKVISSMDPTAHAEVEAIRAASKAIKSFDLSGTTLYTSCEPCPMCLAAIYWAKIPVFYYGNTRGDAARINFADDFIYQEISQPPADRRVKAVQIQRDEALKAFQLWTEKTDKITY